jgi:hypothetical protein
MTLDPRRGIPVRVHGSAFADGVHRLGYIDDHQPFPAVTRVRMDPSSDILGTYLFASRSLLPLPNYRPAEQAAA